MRLLIYFKQMLLATLEGLIKVYHLTSPDRPQPITPLLSKALDFLVQNQLYQVFSEEEAFLKADVKLGSNANATRTVIRCSLAKDFLHGFDSNINVKEAYYKLETYFIQDPHLERKIVVQSMRQLKTRNLLDYINKFQALLTKYTHLGGDRNCDKIVNNFKDYLPPGTEWTQETIIQEISTILYNIFQKLL